MSIAHHQTLVERPDIAGVLDRRPDRRLKPQQKLKSKTVMSAAAADTTWKDFAAAVEHPVYAIVLGLLGNALLTAAGVRDRLAGGFRTEFFIRPPACSWKSRRRSPLTSTSGGRVSGPWYRSSPAPATVIRSAQPLGGKPVYGTGPTAEPAPSVPVDVSTVGR
jgi:hypothetical protein